MSFNVDPKYNMELTRGDTAYFDVSVLDDNGDPYALQNGDKLLFTVKRSADDQRPLVQKQADSSGAFKIEPADTQKLPYGKYVYDVELDMSSGDVFTVIDMRDFELEKEVTW